MSRSFWFLTGAASGIYALVKVKRTAENFTPDGVGSRVAAAKAGVRVFADEVAAGMGQREADLLAELRTSAPASRLIAPPSAGLDRESLTDGNR